MTQQVPTEDKLKEARERVMKLAREIEGLSREPLPPNEFFPQFLDRVVAAVGAQAGAVWLLHNQSIALAAGVRLESVGLNNPQVRGANDRILGEILQTGEACTRVQGDGGEAQVPTNHMLVLCALHKEKQCVGVVELFQRPDAPEEARAGYLQFLEQMSGYASRFIEGKGQRTAEADEAPKGFWQDLEPFTLRLQQTLHSEEVSEIAASDGRLLLEVDRLSVVIKKGAKVDVKAVSGQTSVNPRANLIRAMTALGEQVIAMGEPLMYSGRIENLAPQIEKPLANFVQESTSRMVYLVPMFENLRVVRPDKEVESGQKSHARRKAIGCLVVEQVSESEPAPSLVQRSELLADHIGAALFNARSHERIFGIGVWRRIGRTIEWFHGRRLAIAGAIIAAVVLAALCLVLVPWEYRVEAEGKLMPVTQIAVFATEGGLIKDLNVDGGKQVSGGQSLLRIDAISVNDRLQDFKGEATKAIAELAAIEGELRGYVDPDRKPQLEAQQYTARTRVAKAQADVARQEKRKQQLTLKAPITGLVPNINLRQKLDNKTVQVGEHLFTVMDDKGDWHMEVKLPDKRMGHLLRALEESKDALEGEYTLATNPEKRYPCKLKRYATRTSVDGENGAVVELHVIPEELTEDMKRIGAEVVVKINCGNKSLGYSLFGDVVEAWHKYTWF